MKANEYMKNHNLSDDYLDRLASPYENESYEFSEGAIHQGSHVESIVTDEESKMASFERLGDRCCLNGDECKL